MLFHGLRQDTAMERPLFLPLLSTIAGLATADLFLYFVPYSFLYLSLAASLPFLFLKRRHLFLAVLSFFFFSWGNLSLKPFLQPEYTPDDIANVSAEDQLTIEGVIESRPETAEKGSRLYLLAERLYRDKIYTKVRGRILLYVGEGSGDFLTGDRIRFISRIREPRNFGLPGEFDYVRYLAFRQVYRTAFVKSDKDVLLIRRRVDCSLQNIVDGLAADFGGFISRCAPGEEGFILRALLLGDMGSVSKATKDAYTRTGVNHILSISGFHISIVVLFVFYVLLLTAKSSEFLLLHFNIRRLILTLTVPVIFFYLLLSGGAPATVRSVIMITVYIIAMLLERDVDPLNSLMLAAMVIIACSPPALFDLSFQLSFLALWGILVLTPLLIVPFRKIEGTLRAQIDTFSHGFHICDFCNIAPGRLLFSPGNFDGTCQQFSSRSAHGLWGSRSWLLGAAVYLLVPRGSQVAHHNRGFFGAAFQHGHISACPVADAPLVESDKNRSGIVLHFSRMYFIY